MPSLCEDAAQRYRFTQLDLRRWREVRDALSLCPSGELRSLVEHAFAAAQQEHAAATRHLYNIFDILTTDLLDVGLKLLGPKAYRARLLARAQFHDKLAAQADDRAHAEMHHRLSGQMREAAAAVKIPPKAPPRLRRAHL